MKRFALVCEAVAATSSKTEKVALLAQYLRSLDDADLAAAARFLAGDPLAGETARASVGGATIVAAARAVWGVTDAALGYSYRASGDLGTALGALVRPPLDLGFFRETLTPSSLGAWLRSVAAITGKSAATRRRLACERLLASCDGELEARYVIKVLTGELRIGLREGLVLEAVGAAFDAGGAATRRAARAVRDPGALALAARRGTLDEVVVSYGAPIGFMLATPIPYDSAYTDLAAGSWIVEDKFDGIRAQIHKHGSEVRIFSRTHNDIAAAFPEVALAAAALRSDVILDGEIVARRDGRVLPFRYLQPRLQRKHADAALREQIPASFVAFDLLADGADLIVDLPLTQRRRRLDGVLPAAEHLIAAAALALDPTPSTERVRELFAAARERGNEGLVFKRSDAPYVPGRRGKWWLKLKRELSTIDAVVVAVEWGHGKRNAVLSDYTFAVRSAGDRLLVIGKAYSGLTDAEIATMTQWFSSHRTGTFGRHAIAVEPTVVVEIAFDIIQKSSLHDSGYALRFPRIVRLRPDKAPADADTIADVERIYAEMLEREGVAH